MNEQQNTLTVQNIYDAFGRGDIPYIIDQVEPNVKWQCHLDPVVPWAGSYPGKDSVSGFFDDIFRSVDVLGFEPGEFVAQDDTVVSLGTFSCRAKNTGKSATTNWIFVWKLSNGKVSSYEQFHDAGIADVFRA